MDEPRLGRRRFLSAAGTGVLGAIAGCAAPVADPALDHDHAESAVDYDETNRAEGSVYTEIYEETIDSVALARVFGVDDSTADEPRRGQGSGFVYDERHVVTNDHVVSGGEAVDLQYPNGEWTSAEVVGTDVYSDLAALAVDHRPAAATPLSFTDELPAVGQEVLSIGNPLGLEGSMTRGIVSGVNRSLPSPTDFAIPNAVQTDAPVNPGNSGGPLVDLSGDVVGVISAGAGDNIGFAISSALARRVVPALIEDGEYRHSLLGVVLVTVDPVVARANDLDAAAGVLVTDVVEGGPADGALRGSDDTVERRGERVPVGGDVVLEMSGRRIPDRHALSAFLALETSPGQTIPIELARDGARETVELTLGARPTPA